MVAVLVAAGVFVGTNVAVGVLVAVAAGVAVDVLVATGVNVAVATGVFVGGTGVGVDDDPVCSFHTPPFQLTAYTMWFTESYAPMTGPLQNPVGVSHVC